MDNTSLSFYRASCKLFTELARLSVQCPKTMRPALFDKMLDYTSDLVIQTGLAETTKEIVERKEYVVAALKILASITVLCKLSHDAKAINDVNQCNLVALLYHIKVKGNNKL